MTTLPAVVRIVDLPTATTITGAEMLEVVQTGVGGTAISVQIPLTSIMTTTLGGLPTGGGTSQILAKSSGTNFASAWYDVTSFVSVNTTSGLATSGTGTGLVVGVATGGIGSTQLGALAVQSSNVTTNAIGNAQFRQGSPLSVVGVAGSATANVADITASGALQVLQVNAGGTGLAFTTIAQSSAFLGITNTGLFAQSGTVLATGTFGIVGTTLVTGLFGVVGTSQFTGALNILGTALVTGAFGQVGTSLMTGLFGVSGTAAFTGVFGVVGTTLFTSGTFGIVGTTNITGFLTNVGSAIFTGGTFGVNATANFTGIHGVVGTTLFTSGAFGVVGTSLFTGTFTQVGTSTMTGTNNLNGPLNVIGTSTFTGIHSVNGTTLFTAARFGVVGTSQFTGVFGIVGTTNITGALILSNNTTGMLVSSSTGVVSAQLGGMVLLNTLTPNGVASSNDTTSFTSTYKQYYIAMENIVPDTNTSTLMMQVATSGSSFDTGNNYRCRAVINGAVALNTTTHTGVIFTGVNATTSSATTTTDGFTGYFYLTSPSSSTIKKSFAALGAFTPASTNSVGNSLVSGLYDATTSPITGINFLFHTGNIATGTIRIYGIN